jgi:hypothetical protein
MKSVVIVYPDRRFVERDTQSGFGHPILLDVLERYWTKTCPIVSKDEFWRRIGLVNKLLDKYRKENHQVYWAMFSRENQPETPDIENIHHVYRITPKDSVVPVGISYMQHTREGKYPDEREVLSRLELGEECVCGGFHEKDCVPRFADAAKILGVKSRVDPLLTEYGLLCLAETFERDLDSYLIAKGSLVPDDEIAPETEKTFSFDGRLTKEDLEVH